MRPAGGITTGSRTDRRGSLLELSGVALGFAVALAAGVAHPADRLSVTAVPDGDAVAIEARAVLDVPLTVVWDTLTDYEHVARFIPGIASSRVRRRVGSVVTVEQSGRVRFLFLSYPVDVVLEAEEHFPDAIHARSVAGNVALSGGGYRLARDPTGGGIELRWSGRVVPSFWIPMFISVPALRGTLEEQFRAMVAEIERRAAAAHGR